MKSSTSNLFKSTNLILFVALIFIMTSCAETAETTSSTATTTIRLRPTLETETTRAAAALPAACSAARATT